jgi:cyclic pyranopterin phosphate synthase
MGIEKIRITGGEPFIRKDIIHFISALAGLPGLKEVTLTTNGVLTSPFIPALMKSGVRSVNLSIDTLDRDRFISITHRDQLPAVMHTFHSLLDHGFDVKINAVVMDGINTEDIIPLVEKTKNLNVSVRFIEEMPFNGKESFQDGNIYSGQPSIGWNHVRILKHIKNHFHGVRKIPDSPYSTSYNYCIPGFKGNFGIIAAYTRSFCGTCNRLRLTPSGVVRTCLYDHGQLNIKELLRNGASDQEIKNAIVNSVSHRSADGHEAEKKSFVNYPAHESMASIGG